MSAVILKSDVIGRLIQRLAVARKRDGWHCYRVTMTPKACTVEFSRNGSFLTYRWNDASGDFFMAGTAGMSDKVAGEQAQSLGGKPLVEVLAKSRLGA